MKEKESEGEEIIREFFEENDIKFKEQVKLTDLNNDNKPYRIADFYLPQYKVYLEFLGGWNHEEKRHEYNYKRRIYLENKKPCIYIYPDNLGVLNFIFKRRLKKELRKYPNLKWQLFKSNYKTFMEEEGLSILIFGALIYYIDNFIVRIILSLVIIVHLYKAIKRLFLK